MRVDGSNSDKNAEVIAKIQAYAKARSARPAERAQNNAGTPETQSAAPAAGEGEGRARGALGLLEAGHFKGVAALRISINFADEIQTANGVKTQDALQSGVGALQEELNGAVEAFIAENELSEEEVATIREAQDGFNEAVSGLLGGGENGGITLDSDIFGKLRTAFQDFLNSLVPPQENSESEIITSAGDETAVSVEESTEATAPAPTVTTTAAETESETGTTSDIFAGLRDSLSSIFESTISGLEESVAAINQPVIPEPEGNGRAYEKFLATYNEIYGTGTSGESAPEEEGLNTIT